MSALTGYTGGYPFLRIARHYGLDYGDVLIWPKVLPSHNFHRLTSVNFRRFKQDIIAAKLHFSCLSRGEIKADHPFT